MSMSRDRETMTGMRALAAWVLVMALSVFTTTVIGPDPLRPLRIAAETCEDALRTLLEDPSTAKFSDEEFSGSGATITVTGIVTADSSGVVTSATFSCDFRDDVAYAVMSV